MALRHKLVASASICNGYYAMVPTAKGWRVINPDLTLSCWKFGEANCCNGTPEALGRVEDYYRSVSKLTG